MSDEVPLVPAAAIDFFWMLHPAFGIDPRRRPRNGNEIPSTATMHVAAVDVRSDLPLLRTAQSGPATELTLSNFQITSLWFSSDTEDGLAVIPKGRIHIEDRNFWPPRPWHLLRP